MSTTFCFKAKVFFLSVRNRCLFLFSIPMIQPFCHASWKFSRAGRKCQEAHRITNRTPGIKPKPRTLSQAHSFILLHSVPQYHPTIGKVFWKRMQLKVGGPSRVCFGFSEYLRLPKNGPSISKLLCLSGLSECYAAILFKP